MTIARATLVVLAVAALLALPAAALGQAANTVSGSAVIRQRIALPNNAEVTFQLLDVSRAGAAAVVLAEQKFATAGKQAPFQFSLTYDPAKIQQNGTYAVQGNVRVDGRIRYTTTTQYRVITGGNPTSITITLDAVAGTPLPGTSAGSTLLAIVAALLAVVLGMRWLRPRLSLAREA
jgi:putative lipoprotein